MNFLRELVTGHLLNLLTGRTSFMLGLSAINIPGQLVNKNQFKIRYLLIAKLLDKQKKREYIEGRI